MQRDDASAPATKQDIALLMEEMRKLYQANERWKDEILEANERWERELMLHFDVIAESLRVDIRAIGEPLQDHDRRITRLERHTGLVSA